MSALTIGLAVGGVLFVAIALLSIRFPRGRPDWPLNGTATLYLLLSLLTLVVLVVAMYFLTRDVAWPPLAFGLTAFAAAVLALVAVAALLLPRGVPRA